MLTGELRSQIDSIWNAFWSRFKNFAPAEMFTVVDEHVFPFLRSMGGDDSTYAHHMKDARFTIPTPALLSKVVDMLDHVPMEDRDTKGDLYEYMLSKIASAGQNGQFRTPRHIIRLMVELTAPNAKDVICDPASGTCGFLVAAGEYLREKHPEILRDALAREHFHHGMFHGYDFDNTMLRIGSMNMLLHGVENPDIRYQDSLAQDHAGDEEKYSLILANPPFAGSLDYENTAKDLLAIVKTKKTELLFLALFLRLLKPGDWNQDDKRQPLLPEEKLGVTPAQTLTEAEHVKNNLPDALTRWEQCETSELERPRTEQSFCIPKADIAANGYDLSINRYKEIVQSISRLRNYW